MTKLYPLKFKTVLKEKIWGGHNLRTKLNKDLPDDKLYGESWEVSTHPHGKSIVENGELAGKSLQELLNKYKEELVGEKVYGKYGNDFPLLIKFLDVNDRLSVQVHPDDEYAKKHENSRGKPECWYVMDASEDAEIIFGLKENMTKEKLKNAINNKKIISSFNKIKVKKGDFLYTKPGVVHGTLSGSMLVYEVQENSDITYRLYDFDRKFKGKLRKLDIEKALDVIDYNYIYKKENNYIKKEYNEYSQTELIKNEFFKMNKINIKKEYELQNPESFVIISCIKGEGIMRTEMEEYTINVGNTYLIPANTNVVTMGKLDILVSYT